LQVGAVAKVTQENSATSVPQGRTYCRQAVFKAWGAQPRPAASLPVLQREPERMCLSERHKGKDQSKRMHRYRTHTCGAWRRKRRRHTGAPFRVVHRIRDHWRRAVIDLRVTTHHPVGDDPDPPAFKNGPRRCARKGIGADRWHGARAVPPDTENPGNAKRSHRRLINDIEVLGRPGAADAGVRRAGITERAGLGMKYRFLDLRARRLHRNIMMRGAGDRFHPAAHESKNKASSSFQTRS